MADRPLWKIVAERGGVLFDTFRDESIVAMGIEDLGDISQLGTRKEIAKRIKDTLPAWSDGRVAMWAGMLYRFWHEMKPGDHVVTYDPRRRRYLLGTLKGPCRFELGRVPGDPYVRDVEWGREVDRDALSTSTKNSLGAIATLFLVPPDAAAEVLGEPKGTGGPQPQTSQGQEGFQLEEIEDRALELAKDRVAQLTWEDMQLVVAGLLRAMGYKTRISAVGPDRGKDIVASPDGLGFESPRIVVEVKHRGQAMGAQEVRSFLGGRHPGDKGLYVSTGGFTKDAYYEAERASIPLTLMTLDELVQAVLDHYEKLDIETQRLVPFKRVYWPV